MIDRAQRLFWELIDCFSKHNLLTYASAIAFQLLVALIPLAALSLLLLAVTNSGELWFEHGQPALQGRVNSDVYLAINDAVARVLSQHNLVFVGLAAALTAWEVSGSVRAVTGALNSIYSVDDERSIWHRFALSFVLALGVIGLVLSAVGLVAFVGWELLPAAVVLLWGTMAMLIRFAPDARVSVRWVSVGSVLVVLSWIGATVFYGFYVKDVANFKNAFGFVAAGMLLTGYLYASSIVFLVGVQIDELLRKDARDGQGRDRPRDGGRAGPSGRRRRRSRTAASGGSRSSA